jgi:hypothetical protein
MSLGVPKARPLRVRYQEKFAGHPGALDGRSKVGGKVEDLLHV